MRYVSDSKSYYLALCSGPLDAMLCPNWSKTGNLVQKILAEIFQNRTKAERLSKDEIFIALGQGQLKQFRITMQFCYRHRLCYVGGAKKHKTTLRNIKMVPTKLE